MSEHQPDLSVDGPNSPISLDKFLKTQKEEKPLTLLVDGTGLGIAKDSAECIYVTPEECSKQAIYYSKELFDGVRIPAYLFRYLVYMFREDHKQYETDQEVVTDMTNGTITLESEIYKYVVNLIKWCDTNKESAQVIGMIQLIGGSLNIARKSKAGIKLYIEHPETALHPKRCSRAMSMIMKLKADYGIEDKPVDDNKPSS